MEENREIDTRGLTWLQIEKLRKFRDWSENLKLWAEYHHSSMSIELETIWRGTEEQIVEKFKKDFDWPELTYEELMDGEFQREMDFTLDEYEFPLIQDLPELESNFHPEAEGHDKDTKAADEANFKDLLRRHGTRSQT